MKNKGSMKPLIYLGIFMLAILSVWNAPVTAMAQTGDAAGHIVNQDDLRAAILAAQPGDTIYAADMDITKELYFDKDVDVTIASATGEQVTFNTAKPSSGTYPFNFNGGNVNLTFENVVIEGDDTHVLMRCQNTGEVSRKLLGQAAFFAEQGQLEERIVALALGANWLNAYRPSRQYGAGALTQDYPTITAGPVTIDILYVKAPPETSRSTEAVQPDTVGTTQPGSTEPSQTASAATAQPGPTEPAAPSPGQELVPDEENGEFVIIEEDGTPTGELVIPSEDGSYEIIDAIGESTGKTVVPRADGAYEVIDTDGTPLGQWADDGNGRLLYEQYHPLAIQPFRNGSSFWYILLFSVGLLGIGLFFLLFKRRKVTRAEFVHMVAEAAGLDEIKEDTTSYADVPDDKWCYSSVMSARSAGLLTGFAGNEFKPDIAITREEIASVSAEAARYIDQAITAEPFDARSVFRDSDSIDERLWGDVQLAVHLRIIRVDADGRFDPKGLSTREQVKKIIRKLLAATGLSK